MAARARTALALAGLALAGLPSTAGAAQRARPLLDLAPTGTAFRDHVGDAPRAARARAAQTGSGRSAAYTAADGQRVAVTFSRGYRPDAAVAQSYVDFLSDLPHGRELSKLRILLATPPEVEVLCGGGQGTLACYSPRNRQMTVPGEQVQSGGGVTTAYVVAHEYGHHVAAHRSNAPWPALHYGPKRWASAQMVCLGVLRGSLYPGDQGRNYLANPGEGWADTYAHLVYPDVGWQYTERLRPDEAAYAAARRDVHAPWPGRKRLAFSGRFGAGPHTRSLRFPLTMDGSLTIELRGPRRAEYDLRLSSSGKVHTRSRARGSRDRIHVRGGCRDEPVETLTVTVVRRSGSGPFSVRVTYPR